MQNVKRTDQAFSAFKKKHNQESSTNTNKKKGKCFNCGRQGHFAAQCRDRNRNSNGKSDQKALAIYAFGTNSLRKNTWCVDSGATSHL
ncbi:hypothetical protein CVS40_11551 [Lucilia cuprina]|nr:hypothetical protein CVS40_11551 [Lucilia cuprina]